MIKQAQIPDSAKHMPFVAMLREASLRDDWGLRQDAADRISALEDTLREIERVTIKATVDDGDGGDHLLLYIKMLAQDAFPKSGHT